MRLNNILLDTFLLSCFLAEGQVSTSPRECLYIIHNDFSECGTDTAVVQSPPDGKSPPEGKPPSDGKSPPEGNSPPQGKPPPQGNSPPQGKQPPLPQNNNAPSSCIVESICKKTFRLSVINLLPFSGGMEMQIKSMLSHCCGDCVGTSISNRFKDISEVNVSSLNKSDIVFPVFSRSANEKLYGFWFIPFIDIPSAYFVRKRRTGEEMMTDMLIGFGNLWPLLVICILFTALAGFVGWILETWKNKDQFPRAFLDGMFEGFWWSFISMTTVGYGDKAPLSRTARIFSIGWILIGITMFSMFTASLTTIITSVEQPPNLDISGKTVGALKNRIYDATVIARNGGMLHAVEHINVTSGISQLLDVLFSSSNVIDGFLLDRHTYYFYRRVNGDKRLKDTVYAEKNIEKEKLSYGMLVRNREDYDYLRKYFTDNWFAIDTCLNFMMNRESGIFESEETTGLFSMDSGLFWPSLIGTCVAFGLVIIFGIVYEHRRKKHEGFGKNVTPIEATTSYIK